jgi:hypothetical protein
MPVPLQLLLMALLNLPFDLMRTWDAAATARLQAELKAIRDAGDPVTMVELAKTYPDPPPGRNAATFYKAAFEKMEGRGELPENVRRLLPLPLVGTAQLPEPGQELPPAMLKAIRDYLGEKEEVLDLLRKATALDECKFDLDFTKGIGMLLPHLSAMSRAARLLVLAAVERAASGRPDEAAESLVACLRIGSAVKHEPIFLSALVRIASDYIAVGQVERWAVEKSISPQALERVEAALAAAADPTILERAMVGERCFGIYIHQNCVLKPELLRALGLDDMGGGPLRHLVPQAYLKADMLCYLGIMNQYVAAARRGVPEGLRAAPRAGGEIEEMIPRCFFVSRQILPALGGVFTEVQRHMARLSTARVALAALRYGRKNGLLPENLDALVPNFIPAVPSDPFDGKPLRYRKDATGFVVYTVGENGKDDGGDTQTRQGRPPDTGFRVRWPKAHF